MARVNFDNSFFERERQDAIEASKHKIQPFIPDDANHRVVFDVLSDHLQPDSSIQLLDALERILPLYCVAGPGRADPLLDMILELARQIPYHNPAQSKLVEFIQACGTKIENDSSLRARSRMRFSERVAIYMNDFFTDPDEIIEDDEAANPSIYVNTTAFSALCQRAGVISASESNIAYDMNAALASDRDQRTEEVRNVWITGAAQWIIHSAEQCFRFAVEKAGEAASNHANSSTVTPNPDEQSFWRKLTGRKASKPRMPVNTDGNYITMDKWRVWKGVFAASAHDESLTLECRAAARDAADLMAGQEKLRLNS